MGTLTSRAKCLLSSTLEAIQGKVWKLLLTSSNLFSSRNIQSHKCETLVDIPRFFWWLGGSAGKESACNAGNLGSIPRLGWSPGEGKGYPLQYSGLENSMDYPWGHKELDTTERLSVSQSVRQGNTLFTRKMRTVYILKTLGTACICEVCCCC